MWKIVVHQLDLTNHNLQVTQDRKVTARVLKQTSRAHGEKKEAKIRAIPFRTYKEDQIRHLRELHEPNHQSPNFSEFKYHIHPDHQENILDALTTWCTCNRWIGT